MGAIPAWEREGSQKPPGEVMSEIFMMNVGIEIFIMNRTMEAELEEWGLEGEYGDHTVITHSLTLPPVLPSVRGVSFPAPLILGLVICFSQRHVSRSGTVQTDPSPEEAVWFYLLLLELPTSTDRKHSPGSPGRTAGTQKRATCNPQNGAEPHLDQSNSS